ncbi:hypothetical protein A2U01_0082844, partial [Trifolium medium]|nr:hypothetical protein [Trifolium medium]
QLKVKNSSSKGKHVYSPQSTRPCFRCGNYHKDECMKGKGVCNFCKQPRYMRNDCPKWKSLGGAEGSTKSEIPGTQCSELLRSDQKF